VQAVDVVETADHSRAGDAGVPGGAALLRCSRVSCIAGGAGAECPGGDESGVVGDLAVGGGVDDVTVRVDGDDVAARVELRVQHADEVQDVDVCDEHALWMGVCVGDRLGDDPLDAPGDNARRRGDRLAARGGAHPALMSGVEDRLGVGGGENLAGEVRDFQDTEVAADCDELGEGGVQIGCRRGVPDQFSRRDLQVLVPLRHPVFEPQCDRSGDPFALVLRSLRQTGRRR